MTISRTPIKGKDNNNVDKESPVVDFEKIRNEKLEEKRRKTERIFFKHLMSVYCVTGNDKMRALEFVDCSETGCSFQIPYNPDSSRPFTANLGDIIPVRLYFSQDTYLLVHLKIENSSQSIDNGERYIRFGCSVDQSLSSYEVYKQFVQFMKLYSVHSHKDSGNISFFYG